MQDRTDLRPNVLRPAQFNTNVNASRPVLCVDLLPDQTQIVRRHLEEPEAQIQTLRYTALSDEILMKYRPELVVTPLFSDRFDAVDVAEALAFAGYYGELWAIGPALPNPRLIEQELRDFAHNITCRLILEAATPRTGTGD